MNETGLPEQCRTHALTCVACVYAGRACASKKIDPTGQPAVRLQRRKRLQTNSRSSTTQPFAIRVTQLMHSPASTTLPPAFVPDVVPVGSPGEKKIGGTAGPGLEVSTLQARNPRDPKHPNRTPPADTSANLIPTRRRQCIGDDLEGIVEQARG